MAEKEPFFEMAVGSAGLTIGASFVVCRPLVERSAEKGKVAMENEVGVKPVAVTKCSL